LGTTLGAKGCVNLGSGLHSIAFLLDVLFMELKKVAVVKELSSLDAYRKNPRCNLCNSSKQKIETVRGALTSSGDRKCSSSHEVEFVLPSEEAFLTSLKEDSPPTLKLQCGKGHMH
jgi:hypothetical protein